MAASWLPLAISYLFDWVLVIILAAGGGILTYISGYHRPFALTDIAIAYPDKPDIVSIGVCAVVALIIPALIIFLLCIAARFFGAASHHSHHHVWVGVLWEIHAGVIGLCVSIAGTLFVTAGLKDMVGKPRPNLLARCNPDLSNIGAFTVSPSLGSTINSEAGVLVTSAICRQTDRHLLDDSFAAFPSGHSSVSCAGLVYLSLWLCARFALAIPHLDQVRTNKGNKLSSVQEQSAPPLWQLGAALTPTIAALFICGSRYADFHHAGFDIICGAILGTIFAFTSFRLFHQPMGRSRGLLTWGERSRRFAFFSSPAKYDRGLGDSVNEVDETYELRNAEAGAMPTRVDTHNSERPMLYEPYGRR